MSLNVVLYTVKKKKKKNHNELDINICLPNSRNFKKKISKYKTKKKLLQILKDLNKYI